MTGIDAWREETSDLERVWLENFLAECFDDPWHITHRNIESSGWTVALVPNRLGANPLARLRSAYDGEFPEVWVIEDHQVSDPEYYRVGPDRKHFMSAASTGGVEGSVIVPENREFLFVHNVSGTAVHRWVVCAERSLLEETMGTSLETRWIQYRLWAEWGEGLESATEEMHEYADWYAPYNGLEKEPDLERARAVVSESLESVALPSELGQAAREWVQEGVLRKETLRERQWLVGPLGGIGTSLNRRLWRWAAKADRIASAARDCGVEEAFAVPVGSQCDEGYVVPMTRDGLMAFENCAADRDLVLMPENEEFVVFGSSLRYFLCAGERAFVRKCLGGIAMDWALIQFDIWIDRHRTGRSLSELSNPGDAQEMHRRVLDWCETRWLEYLDER